MDEGVSARTRYRKLRIETRPAVLLRPGQSVATEVLAADNGRLDFALGLLPTAPEGTSVRLEVSATGVAMHGAKLAAEDRDRWQQFTVPLTKGGPIRLTFRAEAFDAQGRPLSASQGLAQPWIALGAPRVTHPTRRGRVLIWISQDAVRADYLSAYGAAEQTTPSFDRRMASWGIFEKAMSAASWTMPSLVTQFTSRYPSFHGAVSERRARDTRYRTLFEVLAAEGFTVLGVTANTFVSSEFLLASGFDALWYTRGRAGRVTALAEDALEEWGGGDLCLFVHYMDAHYPYNAPKPFGRMFDAGFRPDVDVRDPAQVEHTRALYRAAIAYTDQQIGKLLDVLEARGLLQDGVLVYTADHGEEFLDHGGWAHAFTVYEELLRVPFAMRIPGLGGRRITQVVSMVDLSPTLLEVLGIAAPPSFQGRSLMPLLRGGTLPPVPVFAETERTRSGRHLLAVRDGRSKYILHTRPGLANPPAVLEEELYDLENDRQEQQRLEAAPERERLRRYALSYLRHASTEARPPEILSLSRESEERLRALGYLR